MNNRLWNCTNPYQGDYKKVLCVCSAGLLRSPTAAWVLSNQPFNYNTRAVGLDVGHALIPIDEVHLAWADVVVAMDSYQTQEIDRMGFEGPLINLDIPDNFEYRDPKLVTAIFNRCYEEFGIGEEDETMAD